MPKRAAGNAPVGYAALVKRLEERGQFRIKPGLMRIRRVLRELRNPQEKVPCIHIAGTNGKGSVAAFLDSILRAAGYRTALYTSPHLIDLRERIQSGGVPISETDFIRDARDVWAAEQRTGTKLTYFEFLTAVGFLAAARSNADLHVLECGLGGQWDATNAIRRPLIALISSIGLDHCHWLGHTEAEIALQKAGIIKKGVPVVSGARGPGATVIHQVAREKQSALWQLSRDFGVESLAVFWTDAQQEIRYWEGTKAGGKYIVNLVGLHQAENAGLAIAAVRRLRNLGWQVLEEAVVEGLSTVRWPGRFQTAARSQGAPLLFDGAHNPHAMRTFLQTLQSSHLKNRPKSFVFSAYHDKDYHSMAALIGPLASAIYIAPLPGSRGTPLTQLRRAFKNFAGRLLSLPNPRAALRQALVDVPQDGVVVVTGSLALVGSLLGEVQQARAQVNDLSSLLGALRV